MAKLQLTEDTTVLVAISLAAILVLSTVAYTVLSPKPVRYFFEIYPLGAEGIATNYPTEVAVGQPIKVWIGVSNHMGRVEYILVYVKVGANATAIPDDKTLTPSTATPYKQLEYFLMDNQTQTFPVTLSINKPGINYNLMFELWYYNETAGIFRFPWNDGSVNRAAWAQIWINVTA